ncbi:MAG: ATP-binding protein [Bacteroidia bacterium]|nr:ATP-binding protein [Bacteroidia bacterium]MDW8302127.1 ATP-binding protein [Bacteroidia bacterium]
MRNLSDIRAFVADTLKEYAIRSEIREQVILAIDEACANTIIHSNNCCSDRFLELTLNVIPEQKIAVQITDTGSKPVLPNEVQINLEENIRTSKRGGMGLYLMQEMVDKIVRIHEPGKNIIILEKRLNKK